VSFVYIFILYYYKQISIWYHYFNYFQLFYTGNGVYVVMNLKPSYIKIKRT